MRAEPSHGRKGRRTSISVCVCGCTSCGPRCSAGGRTAAPVQTQWRLGPFAEPLADHRGDPRVGGGPMANAHQMPATVPAPRWRGSQQHPRAGRRTHILPPPRHVGAPARSERGRQQRACLWGIRSSSNTTTTRHRAALRGPRPLAPPSAGGRARPASCFLLPASCFSCLGPIPYGITASVAR